MRRRLLIGLLSAGLVGAMLPGAVAAGGLPVAWSSVFCTQEPGTELVVFYANTTEGDTVGEVMRTFYLGAAHCIEPSRGILYFDGELVAQFDYVSD